MNKTMEINAGTLKDKLICAINKRMQLMNQGKTEAVNAIAVPLDVQPRQIYKWMKQESFPHNAQDLVIALDTVINELDQYKSDIRDPKKLLNAPLNFPFKIVIPNNMLKISKDEEGNITIQGSLSMKLL